MVALAPEQYKDTLLFLGTAGLIVPLFRRMKISPVIGFLTAGAALGPHGLGAVVAHHGPMSLFVFGDVKDIEPFAEFGVVFLLFMIGLELSFERLTRLRRLVFGLGSLQLFVSGAVLGLLAFALGLAPAAAIVVGAALALSSTAVIIPVMAERKRLGTGAGRTVFSVLLFQDLMVAPLIFLVTMLSIRTGGDLGLTLAYTLLPAICGLLLLVGGGRLLLRPLFHHVADAGSTEFFMAACLLVVIGTGVVTALSGLSMGLGAFIAGLLLAETEYRREIEVTIEPFKGLLLGLFFVAIGAGLDFPKVAAHPGVTLGLAAGFIAIKTLVTFLSARAMKLPWRVATESALMLAPGGEFAFVLVAAAIEGKIVAPANGTDVEIAVTLSLFAVPALAALASRVTRRMPSADKHLAVIPGSVATAPPRAILVGYGRVGQLIGEMMRKHAISYLAIDESVTIVRSFRRTGISITWGSGGKIEFLERCGLATASAPDHHARRRRHRREHRAGRSRAASEPHHRRARARCRAGGPALRARRDRCRARDDRGQPATLRGGADRHGDRDGAGDRLDPRETGRVSQGASARRGPGRGAPRHQDVAQGQGHAQAGRVRATRRRESGARGDRTGGCFARCLKYKLIMAAFVSATPAYCPKTDRF